jgi:hypothetical protein
MLGHSGPRSGPMCPKNDQGMIPECSREPPEGKAKVRAQITDYVEIRFLQVRDMCTVPSKEPDTPKNLTIHGWQMARVPSGVCRRWGGGGRPQQWQREHELMYEPLP